MMVKQFQESRWYLNLIKSSEEKMHQLLIQIQFGIIAILVQLIRWKKFILKKIKNILLIVNNVFCFDKRFNGDFEIKNNILLKKKINNFKYTGCQIFNRELILHKQINYFPISEIWDTLLRESKLMAMNILVNLNTLLIMKYMKNIYLENQKIFLLYLV